MTAAVMLWHFGDRAAVGLNILTSPDALVAKEVLEIVEHWFHIAHIATGGVVGIEQFLQVHDVEITHHACVTEPYPKPDKRTTPSTPPTLQTGVVTFSKLLGKCVVSRPQSPRLASSFTVLMGMSTASVTAFVLKASPGTRQVEAKTSKKYPGKDADRPQKLGGWERSRQLFF